MHSGVPDMDVFLQAGFNEGGNMRVRGRLGRAWDGGELIGRPQQGKRENLGEQNAKLDASPLYIVLALSVSN